MKILIMSSIEHGTYMKFCIIGISFNNITSGIIIDGGWEK